MANKLFTVVALIAAGGLLAYAAQKLLTDIEDLTKSEDKTV